MSAALKISKVSKSYRTSAFKSMQALDSVSFEVQQGEVFGFLGPNGAGKTTLIKIIAGIMAPDKGECSIFGEPSLSRAAKLRTGYLPERPYFHEFLTCTEFLRFHGRLLGMDDDVIDHRIGTLLKKVDLAKAHDKKLRNFSKGMLQRAGFAQALLHDPEILILDEPLSGLDPVGRREVRDIITEVSMTGKTIFFSTHIIHDVEVICSSVGFIQNGKLKGASNVEELVGKTVKSMEIRFALPFEKDPHRHKELKAARRTMDGWVVDVEGDADELEEDVNGVLESIIAAKGRIRSVVPRKSTLEDWFFEEK